MPEGRALSRIENEGLLKNLENILKNLEKITLPGAAAFGRFYFHTPTMLANRHFHNVGPFAP